ncbi:MAG: hypothetical protein LUC93_15880 [Planctomycetaceae bacterium]|nr:hypothetical protein [Planctomycetaceae bacterium]
MATIKTKSRSLAFPSDVTRLAEIMPASMHGKGKGLIHGEAIRRGGVGRHEKMRHTPGRSPVKEAASAEMGSKPLTIKSIKKVAKAERRQMKEAAAHRYMERVEQARKSYMRNAAKSRDAYEKAKEDAREEMEQLVTHAKDKYQFTVDMARDMSEDNDSQTRNKDDDMSLRVRRDAQDSSVEEEFRQAVLGG